MPRKATHSRYRRPLFILIILLSLFLCVPPRLRRRLARKEPAGRALSSLACLPRAAPVPEGRLVDTLTCFRLASHRSLGTVIVLSSVTWFFGVRNWALLSERDVPYLPNENWAARVSANSSSINDAPGWAYDPNWDGVVQRTETWEHLEGIEPLCVPFCRRSSGWRSEELPSPR
jgi:hypothetical protein